MEDEKKDSVVLSVDNCTHTTSCTSITLSESTITVTVTSPQIEQELNFPGDIAKDELSASLIAELGSDFKPMIIEQIIETVENKGIFYGDFEMGMSKDGFKFRISRAPRQIIKKFFKIKGEK